ncbi:hypothetical protein [Pseudomonas costantinii]|uniref:hypothetical protein n=1 Tax=Pseudomonas costantinii TaxID=168469 RepID=UPI001113D83A|nr:hypothetical protein [Pseudomonas costantinii]NVZ20179.1 hypothetical protein [Pseudomonas costantinii]
MASAGGKISFAHEEVQPGATLLFMNFLKLNRKKSGLRRNPLRLGAFTSYIGCSCSEKEQKHGVLRKTRLGATYSQETGCTLFALLNSIRAQGATASKVRFIGWRLSWGNVSHKCAAHSFVYPVTNGWSSDRPLLHKNKARASLL